MNQITKLMASVTVLIAANALILVAYNGITVYHSGTVAEYLLSPDYWLRVWLEGPLSLTSMIWGGTHYLLESSDAGI